jgi:hypothetical protein
MVSRRGELVPFSAEVPENYFRSWYQGITFYNTIPSGSLPGFRKILEQNFQAAPERKLLFPSLALLSKTRLERVYILRGLSGNGPPGPFREFLPGWGTLPEGNENTFTDFREFPEMKTHFRLRGLKHKL